MNDIDVFNYDFNDVNVKIIQLELFLDKEEKVRLKMEFEKEEVFFKWNKNDEEFFRLQRKLVEYQILWDKYFKDVGVKDVII